jgi:hypothetical protein
MASVKGQKVKHKRQYSIIRRFPSTVSGSTQALTARARRLLRRRLKSGVHFFEERSDREYVFTEPRYLE